MNILNIENLSKDFGDRVIFDNVSLGINEHDKIGIIGINGTGKSTLLKIIAGIEESDGGSVTKANGITISYLPQTPEFEVSESIVEYVSKGGLKGEVWDKESEAKTILTKLGITDYSQDICTMSGGQQKRVALARTLINKSDVLIMDEPTNHLDNEMTEWLEEYIRKYKGVLIMVTHDRYFLDSVANRIVEIYNKNLYLYQANYSKFLEMKCQREEIERSSEQKRKNLLRNELKWVQRGAQARSTKQKARLGRFEELKSMRSPEEQRIVDMESAYTRLGSKTIELKGISKSFGNRNVISDFEYIFTKGINIGIVGQNGCGKTTLLNIISGLEEPDSGVVEKGETVNIGYFTQHVQNMNPDIRVIDYIKEIGEFLPTASGMISASQMLERFLFSPDMQYTLIKKLSGGEKRRLYLLSVLMKAPNVLILDEPTNDLDISTLTVLEDYLDSFNGILITVSHDRYFLDRVADRILAFGNNGIIKQYEGGYTDYRNRIQKNEEKTVSVNTGSGNGSVEYAKSKQNRKKQKLSYKEQLEYDHIDEDIDILENSIKDLENQMNEKASQYSALNEIMEQKAELEKKLEEKMDRWVYLNDLVEELENQD